MTTKPQTLPPLPDPPERTPEDMTNFNQITITGNAHHLLQHLGNPETTLVAGEHYLSRDRPETMSGVRYPDLIVAFGVDPSAYYRSNAYIISEQGKPPDFVLEIASPGTAAEDADSKPADYAALGIPEYWRFNEKPTSRNPALAADRLVEGRYEPITIDILSDGRHRGYSAALNLILEWQGGRLNWIDPRTEEHIPTFHQERQGRLQERERRLQAEARAEEEIRGRLRDQARIRELEAELARRDENS